MDKKSIPVIMGKGLLGSVVLSGAAIMIMALLLLKTGVTEKNIHIAVIGVYVVSCFLSGLYCGKKIKTRRFIWGLLSGVLYFAVLMILSLAMGGGHLSAGMAAAALICMGSGMLGGMLG